jgi:hypothetical protein
MRKAAVGLLLTGAVAAWLLTRPVTRPLERPLTLGTRLYVNAEASYEFRYPAAWNLREQGTTSRLTSPDGETVLSFGQGAEGSLDEASDRFLESFQESYEDVDLGAGQRQAIGGNPSIVVSGTGTNNAGVRIRFLAITVRGREQNYAIAVFTAATSDPDQVLPPVQRIVDSFRP